MPEMITGDALISAVENETFIKGGVVKCAESIKYDFRLSNHILKAKFRRPIDACELTHAERAELIVEPDEVVFVLSEERMSLSADMFAQLSPKRGLSERGILTLGGLTVDPGYRGRLLVGLLNFSSTPFTLKPGKKLIAATFFRLIGEEIGKFKVSTERLVDFPDELVDVMGKYSPVGTGFITEEIARINETIDLLKRQIKEQDDWRQRLDRHDEQIEKMLKGLKNETDQRKAGEDRFAQAISKLEKTFSTVKGGAIVLYCFMALILLPLLIQLAPIVLSWFVNSNGQ